MAATFLLPDQRRLIAFGVVLATMNSSFYLSISVLPLGTVGAIEFLGPIILAVSQFRTARNFVSLGLAVAGVYFLTRIEIHNALIGYLFAFANCALFMLYVSIGHAIASSGAIAGADAIGSGMLIAMITIIPVGIRDAAGAFFNPVLLAAAAGVGSRRGSFAPARGQKGRPQLLIIVLVLVVVLVLETGPQVDHLPSTYPDKPNRR